MDKRQLFQLLLDRVADVASTHDTDEPRAFGRWFAEMYVQKPLSLEVPDGAGDGKIDVFFQTSDGRAVTHHVINAKFTREYERPAPPHFYDEVTRFARAFEKKAQRETWLEEVVLQELRPKYRGLFNAYDDGRASLMFVTNHRRNERQAATVKTYGLQLFHLEDIVSFIADDLEQAMPRTPDLVLTSIRANDILRPAQANTTVPTAIVFAKLIDFVNYMSKEDPNDLLFARNVRLDLGARDRIAEGRPRTVNEEIRDTFRDHPEEFVYSNNGVTLLCEKIEPRFDQDEVLVVNPRVVNGSQTLHSIRRVSEPSRSARVMVKIIQVPQPAGPNLREALERRREIILQISTRTNRQNPIKKWNLVANDEHQNELARVFRRWGLFYQRRAGDWRQHRLAMRSIGVREGPRVTFMAQLVASYHWNARGLGPTTAKTSADSLFDDRPYRVISGTNAEVCYQLYKAASELDSAVGRKGRRLKWMAKQRSHSRLLTFSLATRGLERAGGKFGTAKMGRLVDSADLDWEALAVACSSEVRDVFHSARTRYRAEGNGELTINNFVKSRELAAPLVGDSVSADVVRAARALLRQTD